jgi:hypothetical protein
MGRQIKYIVYLKSYLSGAWIKILKFWNKIMLTTQIRNCFWTKNKKIILREPGKNGSYLDPTVMNNNNEALF